VKGPHLKLEVLPPEAGPPPTIVVDGHEYVAIEIHAHAPSEHDLGGRPKGEVHIVHQLRTIAQATGRGLPTGTPQLYAVLGVFLSQGPKKKAEPAGKTSGTRFLDALDMIHDHDFDRAEILPPAKGGGWTVRRYAGSLTTPGFDEAVTWFVFEDPLARSPREDLVDEHEEARDLQPADRRYAIRGKVSARA
jgi:carbonic anhydrase